MSEDRVDEPFAVQEIWLDGFSGVHVHEETLRCTAFSVQDGQPVAVIKLVMSLMTARHFVGQATDILNAKSATVRNIRSRRKPG